MLSPENNDVGTDGILRAGSLPEPSEELASSLLWDSDLRERLSKPTYKKSDLDRRRQKVIS